MEPILKLAVSFWVERATTIQGVLRYVQFEFLDIDSGSIDGSQGLTFDGSVLALPTRPVDWTSFSLSSRRAITMCTRNQGPLAMPRIPQHIQIPVDQRFRARAECLGALRELQYAASLTIPCPDLLERLGVHDT